ncbi:YbjN domain-containing protein [Consotaella aegiceratis]|uniref:YbjN domain-containing protein n=1 Tax=Consotaella aegiceratis TaxID=3097961 RepID=UPI002F3E434E
MNLHQVHEQRLANPVDVVEWVASNREWSFERSGEDEIALAVTGHWADYSVSFSWLEECESLHLACAFDMKVPQARQVEVLRLLARINEQLLIGHFDLWPHEGAIMFRHSLLLSGGVQPTSEQAERLLACALECSERYFPAFQFVVWADKSAEQAMTCAMFETAGEA